MRWALAVVLMTACSPPPPPPMDAGVEVDAGVSIGPVELCNRFAEAQCALNLRCFPAYTRRDQPACLSETLAACLAETQRLATSFQMGHVIIDEPQLDACERRLKTSVCPPSFPSQYLLAVAQPFSDCTLNTGLLRGQLATGSVCEDRVECIAGTFCVKSSSQSCGGTCVALSKVDEPCGIGCGAGLRCELGTCVPLATLDETCAGSADCEPDLLCLGSCRPRRKIGERCSLDYNRQSPCEPGLACDVPPFVGGEGTCILPRGEFEQCRYHWSCKAGLVCADLDWSAFPNQAPLLPGLCRPPDGADFNCRATRYAQYIGDQCAPGLACDSALNKCRALPVRGEPCTPSRQNCAGFEVHCKPSGAGDVGVCAGPSGQGELCAVRLDADRVVTIPCAAGFCESEVTFQCRPASKPTGALCEQNGECVSGRCVPQADQTLKCAPAC